MKKRIAALLAVMILVAAGCTSFDVPDVEEGGDGDVAVITLVTPTGGGAYLAPSEIAGIPTEGGYPAAPDLSQLPTGYPEMTVVAPSGEIDPTRLLTVRPELVPQVMPSPGRPLDPDSPQLSLMVEAVTNNVRQFLGDPELAVELVAAEPVVWANGGLGCPQEGVNYAEVQVEGSLITVEADGETFTYHTDGRRNFVLCRFGRPVSSGTMPGR